MLSGRHELMATMCFCLCAASSLPAAEFGGVLQGGIESLPAVVDPSTGASLAVPAVGTPPVMPPIALPRADRSGLTGGAGVLILTPFQQGAEAYAINSGLSPASTSATRSVENFAYGTQAAPLVWLGWQFDECRGIRTRFFWFNSVSLPETLAFDPDQPVVFDRSLSAPPGLANLPGQQQFLQPGNSNFLVGGNTTNLSFGTATTLYAIDLEYTHERQGRFFDSVFTAGGRYLGCDQSYTAFGSATGFDPITGDEKLETQSLDSIRNFSGGGPTASWLGRMRIGRSAASVYGCVRGSLLAGTSVSRIDFVDNDFNVTTGTLEFSNGSIVKNTAITVLPVGEINLGIEYGGAFWNRGWFIRVGAVAQDYFGLGSANGSTGDLLLLGGEVAAGIGF